eukprot:15133013-Alexandrium_andersonii.AAC.1
MAYLHLGGMSAPDSGVMLCPFCREAGRDIGVPCWHCGASVDQSVLDFPEEEQLGQARTMADGAAPHLVRPLSDGSDM